LLEVCDDVVIFLRQQLVQWLLVLARLLQNIKGSCWNLFIFLTSMLRQEGQAPVIEIMQTASVQHPAIFKNAFGKQGW